MRNAESLASSVDSPNSVSHYLVEPDHEVKNPQEAGLDTPSLYLPRDEASKLIEKLKDPDFCRIVEEQLRRANAVDQISLLSKLYASADYDLDMAMEPYIWIHGESDDPVKRMSTFCSSNVSRILHHFAANEANPPLSIIVSRALEKDLDLGRAMIYEANDQKYLEEVAQKQESIRQLFPDIPSNTKVSVVAPDAVATLENSFGYPVPTGLVNKRGEKTSLLIPEQGNSFQIDRSQAFLLQAVYGIPEVKRAVNQEIGVDLTEVPLSGQLPLFGYMASSSKERFSKLSNALHRIDSRLRLKLAENFVAADFGEDFGDSLLEIVDSKRFSDKEKEQILDSISSCRKSIDDITMWYKDYGNDDDKSNFAKQYKRAANERLTDVITVFRELARNGTVAVNSGRGKKKIAFNRRSAIEALGYEAKSLEIINGTVREIADGEEGAFAEVVIPPDRTLSSKNRTVYSLYSPRHGYVLLHTRPEGTHSFDPQLEYGKVSNRYDANSTNTGTEASISFITNPVEPFSLPTPYKDLPWVKHRRKKLKINKEKSSAEKAAEDYKHDRVSAIRLDREGRSPGMPADDPNRDPIAPFGMVSVDLSAIGDGPSTPSGKIARLITVGNTLRAQERGNNETHLNHNTEGFSHDKYGTAEGFAKIVRYIDVRMQKMIEDHPPGTGEGLVKKWEKLAEQEELELELAQTRNQRLGEDAMVGAIQTSPILPPAEAPNTSEPPDTPESSDTPESQGTPMSA